MAQFIAYSIVATLVLGANIMVRPSKEDGAAIRAAAAAAGQSVQAYVLQAVSERMEREQTPGGGFGISAPEEKANCSSQLISHIGK